MAQSTLELEIYKFSLIKLTGAGEFELHGSSSVFCLKFRHFGHTYVEVAMQQRSRLPNADGLCFQRANTED